MRQISVSGEVVVSLRGADGVAISVPVALGDELRVGDKCEVFSCIGLLRATVCDIGPVMVAIADNSIEEVVRNVLFYLD